MSEQSQKQYFISCQNTYFVDVWFSTFKIKRGNSLYILEASGRLNICTKLYHKEQSCTVRYYYLTRAADLQDFKSQQTFGISCYPASLRLDLKETNYRLAVGLARATTKYYLNSAFSPVSFMFLMSI